MSMIMSHRKDSNLSIGYKIITSMSRYLQSIDTFIEYLVFSTLIFSLLLGLDLYRNGGKVIKNFFSSVTRVINVNNGYYYNNKEFISYININYPDSNLQFIYCSQPIPDSYVSVGKIQAKNLCQLVIISDKSPAKVITECKKYFKSNRDN